MTEKNGVLMKQAKDSNTKSSSPIYQTLKKFFLRKNDGEYLAANEEQIPEEKLKENFELLGFSKEENRRLKIILGDDEEDIKSEL